MDKFLRPKPVVLPEAAALEAQDLLDPPPERFTHEVIAPQPYFTRKSGDTAAGTYSAGTRVLLIARGRGARCRVADARGLIATTAFAGLRPIRD